MRRIEPLEDHYGDWTVLNPSDTARKVWCKCKCGTEREVWRHLLRAGQSLSCGCSRGTMKRDHNKGKTWDSSLHCDTEVIPGARFGRLTVVGEIQPGHNRTVLCQCECGKQRKVVVGHLLKGNTKSCGCYRKDGIASLNRASA